MVATTMRGFTLIELMVVVSIIGMLSSIVLSSLTSARNKANDSAVKSNMRNASVQAAFYQSNNNNYGPSFSVAACPTSGTSLFYGDTNIRNSITAARTASGATTAETRCSTDGTNFAMSVKLRSSVNHWCVDSAGASKEITNTAWTGYVCP